MSEVKVEEKKRQIIGTAGGSVTLHNITSFDSAGEWLRVMADEGYVLVNKENVLAMIIDGKRVR